MMPSYTLTPTVIGPLVVEKGGIVSVSDSSLATLTYSRTPDGIYSAVPLLNGQAFANEAMFVKAFASTGSPMLGINNTPSENAIAALRPDWNFAIANYAGYAQDAGITGINDGSRDDAPLLRAAYAAAVAAGSSCLALPLGKVYIKSRVVDAVYPYDYALRVTASNFTIIVPKGCEIIDTVTTAAAGQAGANDIFQFSGSCVGSGICGGGKFSHASPGYGNNVSCAVHIDSSTDDCFAYDLSADGLACTAYGTFDNSSGFRGTLGRLKVEDCAWGAAQTSAASTVRGRMFDIAVKNFRTNGVLLSGYDNQCDNITCDNEGSGFDATQNAGFAHSGGSVRSLLVTNLRVNGDTSNAGAGSGILINSTPVVGGQVVFSETYARWFNTGAYLIGTGALDVTFNNPTWSENTNMILRQGACGRVYLKGHVRADRYFNGILCAAGSSGDFYIDDVSSTRMQGSGKLFPTTNSPSAYVMQLNNLYSDLSNDTNMANSSLPISLNKRIQRVASAASVTATAAINGLVTILTGTTNTAMTPPANPIDGQTWTLRSTGAIATFSFATGTFAGAPSALTAGYERTFVWDATGATWL